MAQSLYFNDKDQILVIDYISALNLLREKIYTSDDDDVTHAWERTWIRVPETLDAEITVASKRADELRNKLKKKIQRIAATV